MTSFIACDVGRVVHLSSSVLVDEILLIATSGMNKISSEGKGFKNVRKEQIEQSVVTAMR